LVELGINAGVIRGLGLQRAPSLPSAEGWVGWTEGEGVVHFRGPGEAEVFQKRTEE